MGMPGMTELLIIFSVVFLLFGAKKLPQLGSAVGQSIKNFKQGINTEGSVTAASKADEIL